MPGFDNGCVYFENGIDPRGTPPVVNQMTDGTLLIGSSVSPFVITNTLTPPADGITITSGPGTITFALDDDLAAVEALATTGVVSRTAANTWVTSTVTQNAVLIGGAGQTVDDIGLMTDGQLVIGRTGTFPAPGNLTSLDGSVVITNGVGTINLSAFGVDQDHIFYVGKHGNDTNTGLTISEAFLTFGTAIAVASAHAPSAINRFAIVCLDDGLYAETIYTVSYVDIFAPNAQLNGNMFAVDNVHCRFRQHNVATTFIGVYKTAGTGTFWYEVDEMTMAGTAIGVLGLSGVIMAKWKTMTIVNGFGVGDLTSATGHMHVNGGDIYITGTGTGIARANAGTTLGHVDHILNSGAGAGTAVYNLAGATDLTVNVISTTNALRIDAGTLNVHAGSVTGSNDAYNVTGGTLSLFFNSLTGTRTTTGGTIKLWTPPVDLTNGQLVIGSTGANPSSAALTAGANISVTNGAGSITIAATNANSGLKWETIGASGALVVGKGYICTAGAALSFSLPATAAVGTEIALSLDGSTSWTITQGGAPAQRIRFGSSETTNGAGGSLASTAAGDTVHLVCSVADTRWNVTSSIGNITIV